MDQDSYEKILEKIFYKKLYNSILKHINKKINTRPLLLIFMEIKSNKRLRILNESKVSADTVLPDALNYLLENNFIRVSDEDFDQYVITAKGIWEIEKNKEIITEKLFLDYIDKKWFFFAEASQKLTDKEKVILLSMLSTRTFSEKSPIDLQLNDTAINTWKTILDEAYTFLKNNGVIKDLEFSQLYGKGGNEHPVSHLIRHTDALPKKTKGMFVARGKQKYFLNIYQDSEIKISKLTFLFELIFGNDINYELYNKIIEFCQNIAWEKTIYLFKDIGSHIFNKPEFDDCIKESLKKLALR